MREERSVDPGGDGNRPDQSAPAGGRGKLPRIAEGGPSVAARTEWLRGSGAEHDIVMSSRVRLARNIAGYPFAPTAATSDRRHVLELCRRRVLAGEFGTDLIWVDLHDASKHDRSLLVERQLISRQHAKGQ
ncbi:MAG: hypothetical protein AAF235_09080, partial [Planctomycetota bacterium]